MFENVAITNAEMCGIKNAYFAYGTMFFDAEGVSKDAITEFQSIYPNAQVTVGEEVAVDFTA